MTNIGEVEIGVGADLKEFRRELQKGASSALRRVERTLDDIDVGVDVETDAAAAQIRKMAERIREIELKAILDDTAADRQLQYLYRRFRKLNEDLGSIKTEVDLDLRISQIEKIKSQMDRIQANINVGTNSRNAIAQIRALATQIEKTRASIKVDPDMETFEKEFRKTLGTIDRDTKRSVAGIRREIEVGFRKSAAAALVLDDAVNGIKRSLLGVHKSMRSFLRTTEKTGGALNKSFGSGFNDSGFLSKRTFSDPQASIASLAARFSLLLSSIAPVGPTFLGVAAGASAITGAIGLAAGSLLTFTAVAGSLIGAAGVLAIGINGVGDAIRGVDGAMKDLAPSAQEFVKSVRRAGPAWKSLKQEIQGKLFDDLADSMDRVARRFLPAMERPLGRVAEALNDAGRATADWFASSKGISSITSLFEGMAGVLDNLLPALGNLAKGLLNIFTGTLVGEAQNLSRAIRNMSVEFENWTRQITDGGASSRLSRFLRDAAGAASALGGVLSGLGGVLRRFFGAGAEQGVGLLNTFEKNLDALNEFLDSAEGQHALTNFFSLTKVAAKAFGDALDVLRPIMRGVGDVLDQLAPSLDKFRAALKPILEVISGQLGQALTNIIGPALSTLVDLLTILLKVAKPLAPALLALGAGFYLAGKRAAFFAAQSQRAAAAQVGVVGATRASGKGVGKFGKALGGLRGGLAIGGLLALTDSFGGVGEEAEKSSGAVGLFRKGVGGAALGFAAAGPYGALAGAIAGVGHSMIGTYKESDKYQDSLRKFNKITDSSVPVVERLGTALQPDTLFAGLVDGVGKAVEGFRLMKDGILGVEKPIKHAADGFHAMRAATEALTKTADDYKSTIDPMTASLSRQTRAVALQRLEQSGLLDITRQAGITDRQAILLISGTTAQRERLSKKIAENTNLTLEQKGALGAEADNLFKVRHEQLKANVALAGNSDELRTAKRELRKFIAENKPVKIRVLTKEARNQFNEFFKGINGKTANLNVSVNKPKNSLGGLLGAPGESYTGTNHWRGGWSWVGERGPELVNLPRGSKVLSNQNSREAATAAMSGGGGTSYGDISVTIDVNDLDKIQKVGDFLRVIDSARVNSRKTARSGMVTA